MEVSVDGARLDIASRPITIGTLIRDAKETVISRGRVILSVSIDGREMDAEAEREIADKPVTGFRRLVLETAHPRDLCIETLQEVARHIQPVIDEGARISELIDTGKEKAAFDRIVPCLEVWAAILSAMQKVATLMDIDIAKISADGESLPEGVKGVIGFLQGMRDALAERDLVSVRDALKHQMPQVARRMTAQVEALSAAVAAK